MISKDEVLNELVAEFPEYSTEEILAGVKSHKWQLDSNFIFLPEWLPASINAKVLGTPYRVWKVLGRGPMKSRLWRWPVAPLYVVSRIMAIWLGNARKFRSDSELQRAYRSISECCYVFDLAGFNYLSENARLCEVYPLVSKLVPEGATVLDFGAGIAAFSLELVLQKGCRVSLLDLPGKMHTFALKRFRSRGMPVASISPKQFETSQQQYDAVICFDVLEHLFNPVRALEQITKHLRSGGVFLLNLPEMGTGYGHLKEARLDWHQNGGEELLRSEYELIGRYARGYRFLRKL